MHVYEEQKEIIMKIEPENGDYKVQRHDGQILEELGQVAKKEKEKTTVKLLTSPAHYKLLL